MSARCAGIRWPGLTSIAIQPLDGDGDWRASLLTQREAPDPDCGSCRYSLIASGVVATYPELTDPNRRSDPDVGVRRQHCSRTFRTACHHRHAQRLATTLCHLGFAVERCTLGYRPEPFSFHHGDSDRIEKMGHWVRDFFKR